MNAITIPAETKSIFQPSTRRSIHQALAPLETLCDQSESLLAQHLMLGERDGQTERLPRYVFVGPQGGAEPIRVGLFAGIHGDEPESVTGLVRFLSLLNLQPQLARGYVLFIYPICNPTGFEDNTRHSRAGVDLNREFWKNSRQPEVIALEKEIQEYELQGIIALHADDTSDGFYGYVRGALLARQLMEPALKAAEELLPRNRKEFIDGFQARDGVIHDCYNGVLGAPPNRRSRPFEIILESPQQAPQFLQELAFVSSLRAVLEEYRKFIAYAANL